MRESSDAQRGCRADAPACQGCDRLRRQLPQLIDAATATDHQGRDTALLRCQLQAPALREIECGEFRHHGAEAGTAQRFLHRPQRILVALHAEMQQPVGIEPLCWQGASIKIALPGDPQEATLPLVTLPIVTLPAADEVSDRGGSKARFLQIRPVAGKLMQGPRSQTATRQMRIEGSKSPTEVAAGRCCPTMWRLF